MLPLNSNHACWKWFTSGDALTWGEKVSRSQIVTHHGGKKKAGNAKISGRKGQGGTGLQAGRGGGKKKKIIDYWGKPLRGVP